MSGFIGLIKTEPKWFESDEMQAFKNRNQLIRHRGSGKEEYYEDEHIILGFNRRSIHDIPDGDQSFIYQDKRYCLVFDGEIYNYLEWKESLEEQGMTFSSPSDTEVLIAMFANMGVEVLYELRGMFSLLIWDKTEKCLYGARDRFGIKPFYYKEAEEGLYFASEMKGLLAESEQMNKGAMQHYFTYQYVPEPMTMYKNINRLEPGCYFVKEKDTPIKTYYYFQPAFNIQNREKKDWIERIQFVLDQSVSMHLRSDVPAGAFLSGGIDSTFIVAIAKRYYSDLKTFSVGFEQQGYSEIDAAKETAAYLGVENYSYIISPEEYVATLPKIIWHLDDPLADPACVPLYFVAREARKQVKIALSGEGADELFGGYHIYREFESLRIFESLPPSVKNLIARIADILPEGVKGKSFLVRGTTPLKERYIGNAKMFEEEEKQKILKDYAEENHYQKVTAPFYEQIEKEHPVQQMQYIDMQTWLRGDILLKADKMSMAHGLEVRVPFLDKEVFEVAREIPVSKKITNGTTKYILREAARGSVPEDVLHRKKLGFPVPIRHWLKNELYEWAKKLIQESATDHLLEKRIIFKLLEEHGAGKKDNSRKIWTVLVFMIWYKVYIEGTFDIATLQDEEIESKLVHILN